MRHYRLTLLARQDLTDIFAYIAADNIEAARRLTREIYKAFHLLGKSPELGTRQPEFRLENVRTFSVRRYVVCYRYLGDVVEILRVFHGARDIDELMS